jgi:hypothetical protein
VFIGRIVRARGDKRPESSGLLRRGQCPDATEENGVHLERIGLECERRDPFAVLRRAGRFDMDPVVVVLVMFRVMVVVRIRQVRVKKHCARIPVLAIVVMPVGKRRRNCPKKENEQRRNRGYPEHASILCLCGASRDIQSGMGTGLAEMCLTL